MGKNCKFVKICYVKLHKLRCFLLLRNLLCFFQLKKTLHKAIFTNLFKLDPPH